jgi:rifampicin phosphotransferase
MSNATPWVYYISDSLPDGVDDPKRLLGGKGAGLKDMCLAGLHVPPAFTITTECCRRYFTDGERWPDGLEEQIRANLARLEAETGREFGRGAHPLLVSVRSGAAVSMPGMMDTILNCGIHAGLADEVGDTPRFWALYTQFIAMFARTVTDVEVPTPDGLSADRAAAEACIRSYETQTGRVFPQKPWQVLKECIDCVFRSWNNDRAVAYRKRYDIRGLSGTAVNVQAMFPSQVSGILFTEDPNNIDAGQMVIEASWGLGEAIVSGDVAPDRFIVQRDASGLYDTTIGRKSQVVLALGDERVEHDPDAPCLDGAQIRELCELALRVEDHYGIPMDLEWGYSDGALALLQSRAIRGLDVIRDVEAGRGEEIARLRGIAADGRRVWVTHNLGETLRAPMPLTWDIMRRFMSGDGGFGRMYKDFGYTPSEEVCRDGFLELICGSIYADPARLAHLFWAGVPMAYDLEAILADKSLLDKAPTKFEADKVDGTFLLRMPKLVLSMLSSSRRMKKARRRAKEHFDQEVLPPFLVYVQEKRAQDLAVLGTPEVIAELNARCVRVLDEFGGESLKPGFFGGLALGDAIGLLTQIMGHEEGLHLATVLTTGLAGDITFEQDAQLYDVAHDRGTLAEFLDKFGHRAAGEMELSEPRWSEDPSGLEMDVQRLQKFTGHSPHKMHGGNVARREEAETELLAELAKWGGSSFHEQIESDLADARDLLPYRESGKYYLMMGYALVRTAIVELGERWELGRDVFFLHQSELPAFEHRCDELTQRIAERKLRWQSAKRLDLPDVIDSDDLDDLGLPRVFESATELCGEAVASGVATGPARIVFDPREAGELGLGYILVCPSTDPGWTPLFINAAGLIVERGGTLSHGAIVARDFGIPAVVCPDATKLISAGAMLQVDGNHGRVSVLDGEEN